ncbi:MAG: restriction endonuclease subunit S [Chloroflexi bacterium]|nr:restriction endonuclease subunit S [Chloroflexota bacterium]
MSELPRGWVAVKLGNLVQPSGERADPTKFDGLPYVGLEHLEGGNGRLIGHGWSGQVTSMKNRFNTGDLLYGRLRPYLNKVTIAGFKGVCSTDILVFSENRHVSSKYLLFRCLSPDFVRYANLNASGVQHPRVSFQALSEFSASLPPLPEQHRIVAKIEDLFTRLDAGVEALRKAKAQLKRYRQSVLKSAFEGKLTAEWRKAHKGELEPASVLLERIKEERKRADTAKGTARRVPGPGDTSGLPELPDGWVWTRVGKMAESMKNGIYRPPQFYRDGGVACLRMYNIEDGAIVWRDIKRMDLAPGEIAEYELRPGDILVNRVNSRELVGKAASVPPGLEQCVYESKNIRLRVFADHLESKFAGFWFQVFSQKYFNRNAQQTVGMASINQEQLGLMPFPLAPLQEQAKIVQEIERRFSAAGEVEKAIDRSLKQAERLRQSILKRAFEGKLVPQDPGDEPAEKLIRRIREERAKMGAVQGTRTERMAPK